MLWVGLFLSAHLLGAISLNQVLQGEGISCAYAAGSALSVLDVLLGWNFGLLSIAVNNNVDRLCRVCFLLRSCSLC